MLPNLLSEIGAYYRGLNLPGVCLADPMIVRRAQPKDEVIFNPASVPDCPIVLIVVWSLHGNLVVGPNFLVINRLREEIERINPFSPFLERLPVHPLLQAQFGGYRYFSLKAEELPSESAFYYLQSRLMNPQTDRDQLIEVLRKLPKQLFEQYLRDLLSFIPPQGPNTYRGIVLCGNSKEIPNYNLPISWTTMNNSIEMSPDLFGNYNSFETLQKIGLFSWDYVQIGRCPIGVSEDEYQNVIRAARWLVKPGGKVRSPDPYRSREERLNQAERIKREEFYQSVELLDARYVEFTA